VVGFCEDIDELSGSVKAGNFWSFFITIYCSRFTVISNRLMGQISCCMCVSKDLKYRNAIEF